MNTVEPFAPLDGAQPAVALLPQTDDKQKAEKHARGRKLAAALMAAAKPTQADHPYLARKQVQPVANLLEIPVAGVREVIGYLPKSDGSPLAGRVLVAPVIAGGELSTCELIDQEGRKSAIAGGKKKGGYWATGDLPEPSGEVPTILLGEGVATVLSAAEATGHLGVAALSCHNMPNVARVLRLRYPGAALVILADIGNGQKHAEKAAQSSDGVLVLPDMPEGSESTDFNDLACDSGLEAVRDQIEAAIVRFHNSTSALSETPVSPVSPVQSNEHAASSDTAPDTASVSPVSDEEEISIPEADRPCYLVFNQFQKVKQSQRPLRPGVWYFGIKTNKGDSPPTLIQDWICSPLQIEAITFDGQDNNYGRMLRFRNTRKAWREWAMPMELLRGSGEELRGELLAMGVEISPDNRAALGRYINSQHPKRQVRCTLQVGWCGECFVLPDAVIGRDEDGVIYQSGTRAHDEYTTAGTLDSWRNQVAALAADNHLLILGVSVAFTGPLMEKCNAESGGIHFTGDSSTGKTTIIEAACSVWGGANYKRSWRATANGMEGAASLFNDNLLALDEISECDPREVGAIVYSLGNGRGKQRASRSGAARGVARWRCAVLSSGERTIGTTMAEGGQRTKAGQSVRLLDIPASRDYGAWDCLHGLETGSALADAIKKAATSHHGHAGREYLEKLTRDDRNFCDLLDQVKALPQFSDENFHGQEKRAATRFALFALAGELATEYGITGWTEGAAIEAAAIGLQSWLTERGRGDNETRQICDQVREFIERHGDSRFSDAGRNDDTAVRDRAGWWTDEEGDGRTFLFNAAGMREALKGHDFKRGLAILQESGALDAADNGKHEGRARFRRVNGRGMKLYYIRPDALEVEHGH